MKGLSRIDFSSVAPLMPADRLAGRVAARGEHFEWQPNPQGHHSPTPLAWRRPGVERLNPTFADLTGRRIGRLSVLGIAAEIASNGNGQHWVVRCVCGAYETRRARSIKACCAGAGSGEAEPMCQWCATNRRLQRGIPDRRKAAAAASAIIGAVKGEAP